jgi:ribosome-binding factor A
MGPSKPNVKRAQKESLLFKEISQLFREAALDDPKLLSVSISRVALSPDKGICTVYFYMPGGEELFNKELLPIVSQYKISLRKALAARVRSRYVPELIFTFDKNFEKRQRLEELLEQVKE